METQYYAVNKYASIINRMGMMYFDQCLSNSGIGSGQMFFLLRIYEEAEGISILELSAKMMFDKGTTARAVQKLEEQAYIYRQNDIHDKRIQRLYLSEQGNKLIPFILDVIHEWERIILKDMSDTDVQVAVQMSQRMCENACEFTKTRRRIEYERNHHK